VASSSEQPSGWRPPAKRGQTERWRLASGDDVEACLVAAERLLAQAYEGQRHEQNVRIATGSLAFVTLGSLAGLAFAFAQPDGVGSLATVLTGSATTIGTVALFMRLAVPRRRSRRAQHVQLVLAQDLASMVGNVFLDVANREHWSVFRMEAYKLRLSAFPLRTPRYDVSHPADGGRSRSAEGGSDV